MKVFYILICPTIIKENCPFQNEFNNVNMKPLVPDGGNKIILGYWPNDKHIKCNKINIIPIKIPRYPYILVNRSVYVAVKFRQKTFSSMSLLIH